MWYHSFFFLQAGHDFKLFIRPSCFQCGCFNKYLSFITVILKDVQWHVQFKLISDFMYVIVQNSFVVPGKCWHFGKSSRLFNYYKTTFSVLNMYVHSNLIWRNAGILSCKVKIVFWTFYIIIIKYIFWLFSTKREVFDKQNWLFSKLLSGGALKTRGKQSSGDLKEVETLRNKRFTRPGNMIIYDLHKRVS